MPGFKSDITNKNFQSRGLREVEVTDESEQVYSPAPPIDYSNEPDIDTINARLASRGLPPLDQHNMRAIENKRMIQQESVQEVETRIRDARKQKQSGRERLTPAAKRRIEMLCDFSKNTKDIEIDGNLYILKTLKGKEMRQALVAASTFDQTIDLPFETRRHLLARSLVQIAGTDVELFLGDDSLETKLEFLEELDELVLDELYNGYLKLVAEVKARYAVKSSEDAEGVLADLKK